MRRSRNVWLPVAVSETAEAGRSVEVLALAIRHTEVRTINKIRKFVCTIYR